MEDKVKEKESQAPLSQSEIDLQKQKKSLIIMVSVIAVLIIIGVYFHTTTDQSNENTEAFFKARKTPEAYYNQKESEDSAKVKAERNIFLQD